MSKRNSSNTFNRRTVIKAAGAIGAMQITSPFIIKALGETPIKMGMVDPLTGVYAAVANNEVIGAKFAVEQINGKGGVLGRPLELLVEDFGKRRWHRRAEDAQADRTRSGELHHRRR